MIIDIPTYDDFEASGITFLNLAWDPILELLFTVKISEMEQWDTDGEMSEEFWRAAQMPLITALSLAQQGTEHLIKGKIAKASPFLLIAGNPSAWPKGCDKKDTPFVDFRTIDAQDLIRVHNTVADSQMSEKFVTKFDNLRRIRNKIMHSVDKTFKTTPKEVMLAIVDIFSNLVEPQGWLEARRNYLENHPNAIAYSTDHIEEIIARELNHVLRIFDNSSMKEHFGFNPKQRRYHCPDCYGAFGEFIDDPKLAHLKPNTATSTKIYCKVCRQEREVLRKSCIGLGCKGNVIDVVDNICLLCLHGQDEI